MATLHPFQVRVVEEHTDLHERLQRLYAFIGSDTFNGLPEAEQARMQRQAEAMSEYAASLRDRIAAFGDQS